MKFCVWAPDLTTIALSELDAPIERKVRTMSERLNEAMAAGARVFLAPEYYFARRMDEWGITPVSHAYGAADFATYRTAMDQMTAAFPTILIVGGSMLYRADAGGYYNKMLYAFGNAVHEHHKATMPVAEKTQMVAPDGDTAHVQANVTPFARLLNGPGGFEYAVDICADSGDPGIPPTVDIELTVAFRLGVAYSPPNRVEVVCDGGGQSRLNAPAAPAHLLLRRTALYGLSILEVPDAHVAALRAVRLAPPPAVVAPVPKYVPPHLRNRN